MTTLTRYRLSRGLTIQAFADAVGVSPAAVIAWERGENLPRPSSFPRIANVLGVTGLEVTEILEPSSPTTPPTPLPTVAHSQ